MPTDIADRLFDQYGPTMTIEEQGAALRRSPKAIRNAICRDDYPIPTFRSGRRRLANTDDVARFIQSGQRKRHQNTPRGRRPAHHVH